MSGNRTMIKAEYKSGQWSISGHGPRVLATMVDRPLLLDLPKGAPKTCVGLALRERFEWPMFEVRVCGGPEGVCICGQCDDVICEYCDGKKTVPCDCDGGTCVCPSCMGDHRCEECQGSGEVDCYHCDGTGYATPDGKPLQPSSGRAA